MSEETETKPTLVIFHSQCRDGFAAAWTIWKAAPGAEFVPCAYGGEPPDVAGRDVIMVDFSFPRVVMEQLANVCASLVVLDHHKTAEEALKDWKHPKASVRFDMSRSGAGIAWDHYFPGKARPWTVDYVEDRDLWRWGLPNSKAVNAYLGTLPYEFEPWDRAARLPLQEAGRLGEAVEAQIAHYVHEVAANARRLKFEGQEIPCVNAPQVNISELVGELAKGQPLAMGWWQRSDGSYSYSLRTERDDVDVSAIAKKYGGGGHAKAAGFQSKSHPDRLADKK